MPINVSLTMLSPLLLIVLPFMVMNDGYLMRTTAGLLLMGLVFVEDVSLVSRGTLLESLLFYRRRKLNRCHFLFLLITLTLLSLLPFWLFKIFGYRSLSRLFSLAGGLLATSTPLNWVLEGFLSILRLRFYASGLLTTSAPLSWVLEGLIFIL